MAKKFLSALLAVLMVISMVPMAAMAEGEKVAETVPTLAIGVSASESDAATAAKSAAGVNDGWSASGEAKNILWFAMTGLGSGNQYSLSVKNANGKELLGEKYVSYNDDKTYFTSETGKYWIYVSLDQAAEGGVNKQVNSDALVSGDYTVTLQNLTTGNPEAATGAFTLKSTTTGDTTTWTGTQKTNAGGIKLEVASTGFEGKNLIDIQTGSPKFAVTADGENKWNVSVSGVTLKYVSDWSRFNSALTREQHGYYLGISIPKAVSGNVVKEMVTTGRDAEGNAVEKKFTAAVFTERNNTYCDMFIHLGETSEEVKAKKWTVKLTYGNIPEQTYTFDFSGLGFPSEELKAEATDSRNLLGKDTNDIQTDIVATTDAATKTITVTGTSYEVKTPWTDFDSRDGSNTGNFVALKLTNPAGVPMQLYSPTEKGTEREWKPIDSDGILVRLQNLEDEGYKGKILIGANKSEGTEWTIDYSGVDMRELTSALKVEALNGIVYGKKGSDLQSDITTSRKKVGDVTTISVKGNSNYVTGYSEFSSNPDEQKGNYLALKLTADGTIKIGNTECTDGVYVVILNGSNGYKTDNVTVTRTVDETTVTDKYVLDFTAVKRLPPKIESVEVKDGSLAGLEADYKDGKILLSGMVQPEETNENFFKDATLKVNIGTREVPVYEEVTVKFIRSGDKLEAIAEPANIKGAELSFDTSMLVIKSADATDVATIAAPEASVSEDIPEELKEAADEVSTALSNSSTKIEENILQKYANVISNDSTVKETLVAEAAKIVADNGDKVPEQLKADIEAAAADGLDGVTTVVQTYAKIDVIGVETSDEGTTSFQISITPMARTIVTTVGEDDVNKMSVFDPAATEPNANNKANAIIVKDEEVKISEATEVKLALPDSYKADTAFIKHDKDAVGTFVYEGTIKSGNPRILEFISEHGFSNFTISSTEPVLDLGTDATLSSVTVGDYTVTNSGSAYTVTVPEDTDVTALPVAITATDSKVQSITVNGEAYTAGMTVNLTEPATIVVTAEDGTTTATYTLTVSFGTTPPGPWENPFTDVKEGDWWYDAVKYVSENDLMVGDPNGRFNPRKDLTRAEFAQILYKHEGNPDTTWTNKFSDVAENAWYAKQIIWAAEEGIMAGYGNGKAGPNDPISREQLVSLMWRYEGSPAPESTTLDFSDAASVSSYAKDAMLWAVENGIISGSNGKLNPKGNAMRAEAAQILMQYFSNK